MTQSTTSMVVLLQYNPNKVLGVTLNKSRIMALDECTLLLTVNSQGTDEYTLSLTVNSDMAGEICLLLEAKEILFFKAINPKENNCSFHANVEFLSPESKPIRQ